jgi:hypothetical protein
MLETVTALAAPSSRGALIPAAAEGNNAGVLVVNTHVRGLVRLRSFKRDDDGRTQIKDFTETERERIIRLALSVE